MLWIGKADLIQIGNSNSNCHSQLSVAIVKYEIEENQKKKNKFILAHDNPGGPGL